MKNTGKCPKCGSEDIFVVPGASGAYGMGNNIPIGSTIFSAVLVDRYVCSICGFTEEWIDTKDIEKLQKKYRR
ncbi:hypothetical protein [Facklamia sp. 7083-14-GEN3]|uniref:hypothetical protein n=1 Tax=Facklamia sp. 7083-14-GEN3 TaxID=2973478 RepID=UPI00215D4BF7|nr:hypothetical protein [Facklamia sp. 7083-14-GEN3]MCR8968753.1 hypothetical protein [Facklamia sp. 7083-14-GEN3]